MNHISASTAGRLKPFVIHPRTRPASNRTEARRKKMTQQNISYHPYTPGCPRTLIFISNIGRIWRFVDTPGHTRSICHIGRGPTLDHLFSLFFPFLSFFCGGGSSEMFIDFESPTRLPLNTSCNMCRSEKNEKAMWHGEHVSEVSSNHTSVGPLIYRQVATSTLKSMMSHNVTDRAK